MNFFITPPVVYLYINTYLVNKVFTKRGSCLQKTFYSLAPLGNLGQGKTSRLHTLTAIVI